MESTADTNQHPITEFTIVRSKWARRGKNGASALLNSEGAMCCLGFFAEACGGSGEQLKCSFPSTAERRGVNIPSWLLSARGNSPIARALMGANDGSGVEIEYYLGGDKSEEALEAFITKTFAEHGVTVHFIDGEVAA